VCDNEYKSNKKEWHEIYNKMKVETEKLAKQLTDLQHQFHLVSRDNEAMKRNKL